MQAKDDPRRRLACDPTHKPRLDRKSKMMADDGRSRCEIVGEICPLVFCFFLSSSFLSPRFTSVDAVSRPADHGNSAVMPAN